MGHQQCLLRHLRLLASHQGLWDQQVYLQWAQEVHHHSHIQDNIKMVHRGHWAYQVSPWVHQGHLWAHQDHPLDLWGLQVLLVGLRILQVEPKCLLWGLQVCHQWVIKWGHLLVQLCKQVHHPRAICRIDTRKCLNNLAIMLIMNLRKCRA